MQAAAEAKAHAIRKNAELAVIERATKLQARLQIERQRNVDHVVYKAVEHALRDEEEGSAAKSDAPLDDEWLSRFLRYAEDVSKEQMQEVWGRVLAREARKPGTFSVRTLIVLSNMTKGETDIFVQLAKLTTDRGETLRPHASSPQTMELFRDQISLEPFGITFGKVMTMVNAGIIGSEQQVVSTWQPRNTRIGIAYRDIVLALEVGDAQFRCSHYQMSPAGAELLNLVDRDIDLRYLRAVKLALDMQQFPTRFFRRDRELGETDITALVMESDSGDQPIVSD